MFKNKNVLVTGGTGMIGRKLIKLLLQREANVYVASLDEGVGLPPEVKHKKTNLTEFSSCIDACTGMDYVFNLIGVKGSPKMCKEQPADFMIPMLQFNTNMMEAARRANVKWYLYTSSVGVYHPAEVFFEDDVWKTFPSDNDRFAGWAKRMGELQAEAYKIQYGTDNISIVRPANVYGPFDNFAVDSAMVVPSLIRKAHEGTELVVWGDGSPIRDFIFAEDVALGMLFCVENKITQPINLGSGTGITIKDLVDVITKNLDFKVNVTWDIDKPAGDKKRILDMTRANSFGFKTSFSLEDGIRETIKWFQDNKEIVDRRHNAFK
jgi:GDP-L-fucose synthase